MFEGIRRNSDGDAVFVGERVRQEVGEVVVRPIVSSDSKKLLSGLQWDSCRVSRLRSRREAT
jgi:hypothetical protein